MKPSKKKAKNIVKQSQKKAEIIIILGPPGAGKGIQSELLSEKFGFFYFETAKVGERRINEAAKGEYIEVEGQKYYFKDEKKLWQEGKLWHPPFITCLIEEKIKELAKEGKGIIFAGSPRTLYEGEKIVPLLRKLYDDENIKIVLLTVTPNQSIVRNSRRRICALMRHPILYAKETINLKRCPLDGSRLLKRKRLDDPETIKIRLKEYKNRTLPLINYFKNEGLKMKKVDGSRSVEAVFKSMLKAIE